MLFVHHTKSSLLPSPFIPLPPQTLFFCGNHAVVCVCEVCLFLLNPFPFPNIFFIIPQECCQDTSQLNWIKIHKLWSLFLFWIVQQKFLNCISWKRSTKIFITLLFISEKCFMNKRWWSSSTWWYHVSKLKAWRMEKCLIIIFSCCSIQNYMDTSV